MDDDSAPRAPSGHLPAELVEALRRRGTEQRHAEGAVVVAEGDPARSMYLVHEGELRITVRGEDGRDVELNRLGPGDYFGELMLGSPVRTATARALSAVRLTMVTRDQFEALLAERPDLAFHVIQHLIERVRALSRQVQGLASLDVYGRLARLLDENVRVDAQGRRCMPGPWSLQQLADRVGASRAMVHRVLGDLVEGGYLELGREEIVLRKALPRRW